VDARDIWKFLATAPPPPPLPPPHDMNVCGGHPGAGPHPGPGHDLTLIQESMSHVTIKPRFLDDPRRWMTPNNSRGSSGGGTI
jgi:hypothetical protein